VDISFSKQWLKSIIRAPHQQHRPQAEKAGDCGPIFLIFLPLLGLSTITVTKSVCFFSWPALCFLALTFFLARLIMQVKYQGYVFSTGLLLLNKYSKFHLLESYQCN